MGEDNWIKCRDLIYIDPGANSRQEILSPHRNMVTVSAWGTSVVQVPAMLSQYFCKTEQLMHQLISHLLELSMSVCA